MFVQIHYSKWDSLWLFLLLHNYKGFISDRIAYILDSLLSNDGYIKIDELGDELFISRSSVVRDLKEVRNQLARFNLTIYSKPSFGIKVVGLEKDIRNAVVELKYNNDLSLEIINEFEYYRCQHKNAHFRSSKNVQLHSSSCIFIIIF